jgi:hypothetical protein
MKMMDIQAELQQHTSWNATTQEAHFGQVCIWVDFGNTCFIHHSVLAENRDAEEMVDGFSIRHSGESGGFLV